MTRPYRSVLLALPALTLAVAGLFHPHHLTYDTSWRWFALHLPGLLVFPLVGLALAWLVRERRDPVAWAIRLGAYGYATCYTALDVISGIAAGWVTHQLGPEVPRPEAVSQLFRIGTPLGEIGSWCLVATVIVLLVDQLVRRGLPALTGVSVVPGALLVHSNHIFSPLGVLGMALLGIGTGALGADWLKKPPPTR
jgi:hypothetical protein